MKKTKDASYTDWLVVNAQLGDALALEQLIRLWQERLLLYGINKLGEKAAAQDALQECLISVSRGIGRLRDPAAFPRWAFQIMERRCQDQWRKICKARAIQSGLQEQVLSVAVESPPTDSSDNTIGLDVAINNLTPALSQILRLYYLEEFSLKDIAEIIDVPEGTVKSRLYYARKQLAALLEN